MLMVVGEGVLLMGKGYGQKGEQSSFQALHTPIFHN